MCAGSRGPAAACIHVRHRSLAGAHALAAERHGHFRSPHQRTRSTSSRTAAHPVRPSDLRTPSPVLRLCRYTKMHNPATPPRTAARPSTSTATIQPQPGLQQAAGQRDQKRQAGRTQRPRHSLFHHVAIVRQYLADGSLSRSGLRRGTRPAFERRRLQVTELTASRRRPNAVRMVRLTPTRSCATASPLTCQLEAKL